MRALHFPAFSEVVFLEVGSLGGCLNLPLAGGYDAVWFLVVDDDSIANGVQDVWSAWTEMSVSPLSSKQSDGGLVLLGSADEVPGLAAALTR
jgi:phosphomevalonate kinase